MVGIKIDLSVEGAGESIGCNLVSETKLDEFFSTSEITSGFATSIWFEQADIGGGIFPYLTEDISYWLLVTPNIHDNTEFLTKWINLYKTKWILRSSCNPLKSNIENDLISLGKTLAHNLAQYGRIILTQDLN